MLDRTPRARHFLERQLAILVGFDENLLRPLVVGLRNGDGDPERHLPGFDRDQQPFLASFQETTDSPDMFRRIADHGGDLAIGVAALDEIADPPEQFARTGRTPGDILDQALKEAVPVRTGR